jgi:hypothetical protein
MIDRIDTTWSVSLQYEEIWFTMQESTALMVSVRGERLRR